MNTRRTFYIGLCLFALLMLATVPMVAVAREDGKDPERNEPYTGPRQNQRLKLRIDRDSDGNISLREFHAYINGRLDNETVKRIFNAADKDQNGVLSKREFLYAVKLAMKARGNGIGPSPDKDGDGLISLREFHAYVNGRFDNATVKRIFKAADRDQNGYLSRMEFVLAVNFALRMKANRGNSSPDKDGDGNITLREFHAFINGRLGNDTVKRIFNASDMDGNGVLSKREFVHAVKLAARALCGQDRDGQNDRPVEGSNVRERMRERARERAGQRKGNGRN